MEKLTDHKLITACAARVGWPRTPVRREAPGIVAPTDSDGALRPELSSTRSGYEYAGAEWIIGPYKSELAKQTAVPGVRAT